VRILGREPAAWVGLAEAVLTLLLAFGIGVNQETFGPIMALVTAGAGLLTAWATKDTALGAIVGFVKACLTLFAVYGLDLTDQQTGAVVGATVVLVAFFQRTQTSPEWFPPPEPPVTFPPDPGNGETGVAPV
jgi:hypothetical protein